MIVRQNHAPFVQLALGSRGQLASSGSPPHGNVLRRRPSTSPLFLSNPDLDGVNVDSSLYHIISSTSTNDPTALTSYSPSSLLAESASYSFSSSPAAATTTVDGITPLQEFEPIINLPALSSFLIITVIFTLLQLRINAISSASQRRSSALEKLRKVESLQLSASDVGLNSKDGQDRPTSEMVEQARKEYEEALRKELDLRTVIPGVRIVAPNDPKRDEEERAAAKRFLGWGGEEFGDDYDEIDSDVAGKERMQYTNYSIENNTNNSKRSSGTRSSNNDDRVVSEEGMGNGPKSLLIGVASMLILLLWTLSFDPMQADRVFTSLGGSPPSDLPFSSWSIE